LLGPNGTVSPGIRPTVQRLPTIDQWNATIQRQLTPTINITVSYVGNKGTHLLNRTNIGQGLPPADPTLCDPSTGGDPTNVIAQCPAATRRPFASTVR